MPILDYLREILMGDIVQVTAKDVVDKPSKRIPAAETYQTLQDVPLHLQDIQE